MIQHPGRREVDRALKQLSRAIKAAQRVTNQSAGKLLIKGDYGGAERLVAHAKELGKLEESVATLTDIWRAAMGAGSSSCSGTLEQTPLWEYYRPVLQAILALGGEAKLPAIERQMEVSAARIWKPGDLTPGARGRPWWKSVVKKTRRHLVKEGWLESRPTALWRISDAGKRMAASPSVDSRSP